MARKFDISETFEFEAREDYFSGAIEVAGSHWVVGDLNISDLAGVIVDARGKYACIVMTGAGAVRHDIPCHRVKLGDIDSVNVEELLILNETGAIAQWVHDHWVPRKGCCFDWGFAPASLAGYCPPWHWHNIYAL